MGQVLSRTWFGSTPSSPEEEVSSGGLTYRFPTKNGTPYFASHFIMGGEKFDSPLPESFLFGENHDLNCLGPRPVSFPYPPPPANEPTKTLRSQINIRRDSVALSLIPPEPRAQLQEGVPTPTKKYLIKFTFDTDVRCAITIYFFCREEITHQGLTYHSSRKDLSSPTWTYNKGANQIFEQKSFVFHPSTCLSEIDDYFNNEELGPTLVIQCVALEGPDPKQQTVTLGTIEKTSEDSFTLKFLKQKLFVDGLVYFLQEIYGLENKALQAKHYSDEDVDDCGEECVVCLCDLRDTLILPCRHLCLCYACADSLRYQASNCPICRIPFRALLQIRAVQKVGHATHPAVADQDMTQDGFPSGYKSVSLVEILNGPVPAPLSPKSRTQKELKKKKKSKNRSRGKTKDSNSSSRVENEHVSTISVNYVNELSAIPADEEEEGEAATTTTTTKGTELTERISLSDDSSSNNVQHLSKKAEMAVAESLEDIPKKAKDVYDDDDDDFADCHDFKPEQAKEFTDGAEVEKTEEDLLPDPLLGEFSVTPRSANSNRSSQRSSSSSSSSEQLLSHVSSQLSVGSTKIVNVRPIAGSVSSKDEASEC